MRAASKAFLRALALSHEPRCGARFGDDACERERGHKGRHRHNLPDGSTVQWSDKKPTQSNSEGKGT